MNTLVKTTLALLTSALLVACSDSADEARQANNDSDNNLNVETDVALSGDKAEEMLKGLTDAMTQFGEKVDTVSAKDLKALMPVEVPGMTRTAYSASKKGIEGLSFSTASATFEEDDGPGVLNLSVTDIGNVQGFAQFGLETLNLEIDEENQDGFQRTTKYKGYKSFQSSTRTRSGEDSEMVVFVGDRLVLNVEGSEVEWDLIEDVVDTIPLKKLEGLVK